MDLDGASTFSWCDGDTADAVPCFMYKLAASPSALCLVNIAR